MSTPTVKDLIDAVPADDAQLWERRMKALTMRNAGATFAKIAEALHVSKYVAENDVKAAMAEVVSIPIDDMVARQRAILIDICRVNYAAAMAGDREAQSMLLKTLEHEAKLFGLHAPTRIAVGISDTDFAAQAAELLAALGPGPLHELAGIARQEPAPEKPALDAEWSNIS